MVFCLFIWFAYCFGCVVDCLLWLVLVVWRYCFVLVVCLLVCMGGLIVLFCCDRLKSVI